jgi:hypothetical protein
VTGATVAGGEAPGGGRNRRRQAVYVGVALVLFVWSFLYRYNDPEGSVAGLHDDHYFYLVRGWQMLFGDLPDRDFVDPGAPLTFAIEAAVQWLLGRGVWSEMVFCVTALSAAAVLTFVAARMLSGSIAIAATAAFMQVALQPRLYNYPKVLVYAVAIPVIWRFMDRPTWRRRLVLAVVTAIALLLRHDHGAFVGLTTLLAIAMLSGETVRARMRHALIYGLLVVALLAPYLAYLQVHGGVVAHAVAANSWAQRDRARAPLVLPYFSASPRPDDDPPPDEPDWWQSGIFVQATRNYEPWLFWLAAVLPLGVLALVSVSAGGRAEWPHARRKIALLALLGMVLVAGFLRGRLSSRFGDVSVTTALLLAVLMRAAWTMVREGRMDKGGRFIGMPSAVRAVAALVAAGVVGGTLFVVFPSFWNRLDLAAMTERPLGAIDRVGVITRRTTTWPLESWTSPDTSGSIQLAFYLRDCTAPDDRVFISMYMPEVSALAQRPFAGGHGDLRPSFFTSVADQRLTIARLERQRVPVAIMPGGEDYEGFRKDFPRINAYLALRYRVVGDFELGARDPVRLLVHRDIPQTGEYRLHRWPCFR